MILNINKEQLKKIIFKENNLQKQFILSISAQHNFDVISKFYGIDKTTVRTWKNINKCSTENYKLFMIEYLLKCDINISNKLNRYLNESFPINNTLSLIQIGFNISIYEIEKMWNSKKEWKRKIIDFFLKENPYLFIYHINTIRKNLDIFPIPEDLFEESLLSFSKLEENIIKNK